MADQVIWQGKQWRVTSDGLEDTDETQRIELSIDDLRDADPNTALPAHMAGKRHVDYDEFVRAFLIACVVHRADLPNVGAIVDRGFRMRKASGLPLHGN